jgi:methionine-rich copper-binding protein CopC
VLAPLVVLGLLLGAGTAFAHNVLLSSDPAAGASLDTGPSRVTLRFDLPVQTSSDFNVITVIGPEGGHYENGEADVDGSTVSAAVNPLGPAGRYTIGYRVVSDDGHPVSGSVGFTLTRAGTGHPVAPASAPPQGEPGGSGSADGGGGGLPWWLWAIGAVALLGAGVTLALRAGKP